VRLSPRCSQHSRLGACSFVQLANSPPQLLSPNAVRHRKVTWINPTALERTRWRGGRCAWHDLQHFAQHGSRISFPAGAIAITAVQLAITTVQSRERAV